MSRALPVRARAAVRRAGGRWVRRLGLLPGGAADRLGEDDRLTDTVLPQPVLVYFSDPPANLYQLEQWYAPLAALAAELPVVVITQDSRTTRLVRAATSFPVHCVGRSATLDGLVARSDIGLALYVAHATSNFAALRHASMAHVYLGHGDSDKGISASNQLKAYDFAFVAGDAAVERIRQTLTWYDADARTVKIGRPQLDRPVAGSPGGPRDDRPPRVLYAPTWEGAQPSVRYGSVVSHGAPLLRSLLDAGLDVVYRPHPRTGANDHRVRAADQQLRRLATEHPGGRGRVDVQTPLADAMRDADLLITDISSLAMDWLPSLKPLVVTTPAAQGLELPASRLLSAVPRLSADEAPAAADLVRRILRDDDVATRRALVEHYLGDTTPGVATAHFVAACRSVLDAGRAERRRLREGATR